MALCFGIRIRGVIWLLVGGLLVFLFLGVGRVADGWKQFRRMLRLIGPRGGMGWRGGSVLRLRLFVFFEGFDGLGMKGVVDCDTKN